MWGGAGGLSSSLDDLFVCVCTSAALPPPPAPAICCDVFAQSGNPHRWRQPLGCGLIESRELLPPQTPLPLLLLLPLSPAPAVQARALAGQPSVRGRPLHWCLPLCAFWDWAQGMRGSAAGIRATEGVCTAVSLGGETAWLQTQYNTPGARGGGGEIAQRTVLSV